MAKNIINFNAPINITITATEYCDKPAEEKKPEFKGATSIEVAEAIFSQIVERFGWKRSKLISCVRLQSAYEMYAIGTTGDITFLVWRHPSGEFIIKQQCW